MLHKMVLFIKRLFSRSASPILILGIAQERYAQRPSVIPSHLIEPVFPITGASGSGKSTMLVSILFQLMSLPSRPGAVVWDLKDDLSSVIASSLPAERRDDVLLCDFSDVAFPVG